MTNSLPQPTLSAKLKQWREALSGNDPNSINRQLAQLTWDAASYRVINEARRFAKPVVPSDPRGNVQLSGLMHNLIERGFFISQMTAIRRLTDTDKYSLEGDKGVYSLTGLLNDILKHHELITRRSIFDAEHIEYDAATIERKPHCSFMLHDLRHGHMDFLAGVDPSQRQPSNKIREILLRELKDKILTPCKEVIEHVNKFIAHAATPESRVTANAEEAGITLKHLWDAQKHLCEVAGFLSIYVLGGAQLSFLPSPSYDQFQYIERPLVKVSKLPDLKQVWKDFSEECDRWGGWRPDP